MEMANYRYFADINGEAIELASIRHVGPGVRASAFEGVPVGTKPVFVAGKGFTGFIRATRKIEMKSAPSRHVCDARCFNATGRIMKCECSCGGKNHGRGAFACVEVAA